MEKLLHLQRIRKEKGITLEKLAKLTGLNIQTIQKIESGFTPIKSVKLGTLIDIANALGVNVADIVGDDLSKSVEIHTTIKVL